MPKTHRVVEQKSQCVLRSKNVLQTRMKVDYRQCAL